jgi:hypothetical protein
MFHKPDARICVVSRLVCECGCVCCPFHTSVPVALSACRLLNQKNTCLHIPIWQTSCGCARNSKKISEEFGKIFFSEPSACTALVNTWSTSVHCLSCDLRNLGSGMTKRCELAANWNVFIFACQVTSRSRIESQKRGAPCGRCQSAGAALVQSWPRWHAPLPGD